MYLGRYLGCGALLLSCHLQAAIIAYTDAPGQGVQAFGGNAALAFEVNSDIDVTDLGVFDPKGDDTFSAGTTLSVAIFSCPVINCTTGGTQVGPAVTFTSASPGTIAPGTSDVMKAVTPFLLSAGFYEVVADGYNANDMVGNFNGGSTGPDNTGAPEVTATGGNYDSNLTLDAARSCDGCNNAARQWDAGTFDFTDATAAPEPGTLVIVGLGMAMLAVSRRPR